MSGDPVLLLAAHPTRGVDVGAQAAIWDALRTARAAGLAVLLISADLDELIGLSDTIQVILRGRLVAGADPRSVTPEELGSAMTGATEHTDQTEATERAGPAGAEADRPGSRGPGLTGTGTTGTGSATSDPTGPRPGEEGA